jgi:hypothetical protein
MLRLLRCYTVNAGKVTDVESIISLSMLRHAVTGMQIELGKLPALEWNTHNKEHRFHTELNNKADADSISSGR